MDMFKNYKLCSVFLRTACSGLKMNAIASLSLHIFYLLTPTGPCMHLKDKVLINNVYGELVLLYYINIILSIVLYIYDVISPSLVTIGYHSDVVYYNMNIIAITLRQLPVLYYS